MFKMFYFLKNIKDESTNKNKDKFNCHSLFKEKKELRKNLFKSNEFIISNINEDIYI